MVALCSALRARFLILFLWNLPLVLARIVNRTIDDGFGDSDTLRKVTYLPTTPGVWKNESCMDCSINPDVSRIFKRTYTAATYNPQLNSISITMKFNGTAIYVFFILANNAGDGITTLTLANFTLDGTNPEAFEHAPDLTRTDIDYNQLVYSKQDLINAEHTLVISTTDVNANVYVNFDYVIYTHDDDSPLLPLPTPGSSAITISASASSAAVNASDAKSSPPVGPLVGGVIGGVVLFSFVGSLLFYRRRRASGRRRSEAALSYVSPLPPINPRPAIAKTKDASGSYIDPNANRTDTNLSGSGLHNRVTRTKMKSVSSPNTSLRVSTAANASTSANASGSKERADPNSVETIRRARQNEIDEHLRVAQQEVTRLTSDLQGDNGGPQISVTRQSDEEQEGEMSVAELREQLRVMTEQVGYLTEQQRSAWAQGLSDDPPPDYTLTSAPRNSESVADVPPS